MVLHNVQREVLFLHSFFPKARLYSYLRQNVTNNQISSGPFISTFSPVPTISHNSLKRIILFIIPQWLNHQESTMIPQEKKKRE